MMSEPNRHFISDTHVCQLWFANAGGKINAEVAFEIEIKSSDSGKVIVRDEELQ
jgi:hypothetical protein